MCKKCWIIVSVLSLMIVAIAIKFVFIGQTTTGTDGRVAIQLNEQERDLVLSEMRSFLVSLQQINTGISQSDFKLIADSARKVGINAQQDVPASLMIKLPLEFKKLGFDTHKKFDLIAMDAEELEDRDHSLKQVSELMQNCISCHASHQIEVK